MIELKTLLPPVVVQQSLDRLPKIVNVVLVLVLAATLAQFTWNLVPVSTPEEIIPQRLSRPTPVQSTSQSRRSLSSMHLFGKAEQARTVAPVVQEKVPVSRLNLTLKGVLASTSNSVAKAIIADSSGHENFYSLGMQIPGGATLEEIHKDHVILKRNNRLETLLLPKDVKSSAVSTGVSRTPTPSRPGRIGGLSGNKSTGSILKDWRGKLDTDPQSLMSLVRAEPVRRGGSLIGYRIRPGKDRQLLRKFGLRSGDIVKEVNGMVLDNPLKGLEILNSLKSASQVSLAVERNGSSQSFVFQVDQ